MSNNVIRITDKLNIADSNVVASSKATSELKNSIDSLSASKVSKSGDTITGNLVVDGNVTVVGKINATIEGSAENAMSAVKDSNGNVIVDTYATKDSQTQLDDSLRALIAEELAKYLPLTGGTLKGTLKIGPYDGIYEAKESNNAGVGINANENGVRGAAFVARNAATGGAFACGARDATVAKYLFGRVDGTLTWDSQPIITLVAFWSNNSSWYRKYSDGWIEQGGICASTNHATVTLPLPMKDTGYNISLGPSGYDSAAVSRSITDVTPTTFRIKVGYNDSLTRSSYWHVCGYGA